MAYCTIGSCHYANLFAGKDNITIKGSGSIDGGGPAWWHMWAANTLRAHRPMLVSLVGDNLTLSGIRIHNSPGMAAGLMISGGSRHRVHGYSASVDLPGLQRLQSRRKYESANAAPPSPLSPPYPACIAPQRRRLCPTASVTPSATRLRNAFDSEFRDVLIEESYFGWLHATALALEA